MNKNDLKEFTNGYLVSALFCGVDDDGDPLDKNYSIEDFSEEALEILRAHCLSFFSRMWYYVEHEKVPRTFGDAGHDFLLTSCGHGAGFWDGDWLIYGDMLTKLSKCYPEIDICVGDDGRLHI